MIGCNKFIRAGDETEIFPIRKLDLKAFDWLSQNQLWDRDSLSLAHIKAIKTNR